MNYEEVRGIFLFDPVAHEIGDESMVPRDSFLNHVLDEPFKVAKKALHITSSEYP